MHLSVDALKKGPEYSAHMDLHVSACYFDIDNTLVSNDSPDLPTRSFCALARKLGVTIPIAVATARSLQRSVHILEAINSTGISVLSNGAVLYDANKKAIIEDYSLPLGLTLEIANLLQDNNMTYEIQDNGVDFVWITNATKLKNRS